MESHKYGISYLSLNTKYFNYIHDLIFCHHAHAHIVFIFQMTSGFIPACPQC